jgi:hypothetical protein
MALFPICSAPPCTCVSLKMQYGLLGGGLADGSVCIYNPACIIGQSGVEQRDQLLCRLQKHQGAVSCNRRTQPGMCCTCSPATKRMFAPLPHKFSHLSHFEVT